MDVSLILFNCARYWRRPRRAAPHRRERRTIRAIVTISEFRLLPHFRIRRARCGVISLNAFPATHIRAHARACVLHGESRERGISPVKFRGLILRANKLPMTAIRIEITWLETIGENMRNFHLGVCTFTTTHVSAILARRENVAVPTSAIRFVVQSTRRYTRWFSRICRTRKFWLAITTRGYLKYSERAQALMAGVYAKRL